MVAAAAVADDLGEDFCAEEVVGIGLAEKAGDVDEDVLVEGVDLLRVLLEETDVVLDAGRLVQHHPALEAAAEGGLLVVGEIDARTAAQQGEDLLPVLI